MQLRLKISWILFKLVEPLERPLSGLWAIKTGVKSFSKDWYVKYY